MVSKNEDNRSNYVEKAIISFSKIMSDNQKSMMDNLNRANKGELFVLRILTLRNAEVLPSELSEALNSSTARISALLGALEKKGQIRREIDKSNRRNILVTITEAGRERAEAEMNEIEGRMAKVFTEMGEADTAEFIRLIKLFSDLSKDEDGCQRG
ncbi:MarR family winged helix-turn-helix transcriptional regulator [Paenibacillus segetis]|uniref:MarR family transcriptional regulator n=1 Tax=Paenibacillus segetis TaxID=1325360 RepID=A0ABQ1Y511_9BACL|nr:transcriptional regulator [Paenibacillus segetis]GGH11652.1 MarR family transcriptional regulator [Paenibacillus segetis]